MNSYNKLVKVIHKISYSLSWISAVILGFMMLITFVDVVGRYLFNKPLLGAADVLEQLMVVFIFCVLAQVTVNREHIRADIITSLLSRRNKAIAGAAGMFIGLIATVIMTWSASIYVGNLSFNTVTGVIRLPIAPFYYLAAFGLIICCFELLFDIIRYVIESRESVEVDHLGKAGENLK
jgi:TRAP-type transport system small permease protein